MRYGSDSGAPGSGGVDYPLFLECDSQGQVIWMSERTRLAFGGTETLPGTLATGPSLCFSRVMETGGRILISASPEEPPDSWTQGERVALLGLQGNLLRHYFKLQIVERNLSCRAQRQKRGGGRQAIRQMELERQRLGRDLHTGVGQMLAAIRLQLEVIATQQSDPAEPVRQALERISNLASNALEQVRSISKRMHPPEWQRLTLESSLQQLWDLSGFPERFETVLRLEALPREPEQEVKVLFYRAAQEALSNLARHARATRIELTLHGDADGVVLKIQDNGVGFDVAKLWAAPASVSSGIGLRSIREQAAAIGGKLDIESGPLGTTLIISSPYSPVEN